MKVPSSLEALRNGWMIPDYFPAMWLVIAIILLSHITVSPWLSLRGLFR